MTMVNGPNNSVNAIFEYSTFLISSSRLTSTHVGSYIPYCAGTLCPVKGLPPNNNLLLGIARILSKCSFILALLQVRAGPIVKSSKFLLLAYSLN